MTMPAVRPPPPPPSPPSSATAGISGTGVSVPLTLASLATASIAARISPSVSASASIVDAGERLVDAVAQAGAAEAAGHDDEQVQLVLDRAVRVGRQLRAQQVRVDLRVVEHRRVGAEVGRGGDQRDLHRVAALAHVAQQRVERLDQRLRGLRRVGVVDVASAAGRRWPGRRRPARPTGRRSASAASSGASAPHGRSHSRAKDGLMKRRPRASASTLARSS